MFEELFDGETGEQVLLKHGDHNDYAYRNNTSISNKMTSDAYITTIKHNIISIASIKDGDGIIFDDTYTRREQRTLISIGIYVDTSGSIAPYTSSSLVAHNNCLRKDEDIDIISVQGIIHRVTNTKTDSIVSTNNDNNSTSTANTNYNNTRSELSSEHGERFIMSIGSKYTLNSSTIDSNTHRWRTDYIGSPDCTRNESTRYNNMWILSSVVVNNAYNTFVRYNSTQGTIVWFVGEHSTSIPVHSGGYTSDGDVLDNPERITTSINCNSVSITVGPSFSIVDNNMHRSFGIRYGWTRSSISVYIDGALHNSEMIYDMDNTTASMHTDRDIEDSTYQNGEHRMSIHINGTHNISSLDDINMHKQRRMNEHRGNTSECSDEQMMFECKNTGIGKRMYKYRTVSMKYNTMAIRTSSWIVLTIGYMHTTLHQLESNEHKIVCSRLDGRGVTNFCNKYHIWGTHPISVN